MADRSQHRFQFDSFKKQSWNIEHIRSIASDPPENQSSRIEWFGLCAEYLRTRHGNNATVEKDLLVEIEGFKALDRLRVIVHDFGMTWFRFFDLYFRALLHLFGPAPLGEKLEFSTAVVDRDGKLLRPYTTSEGRWRLPVRPDGVDPRYLALLIAYEDKRFYRHFGVGQAGYPTHLHPRVLWRGSARTDAKALLDAVGLVGVGQRL